MQRPDVQAEIDRIAAVGPLKAWSVIVTILGDLCRDREDRISARLMNRLIGHFGITAQAGRVAIHRLKRDGWVETDRQGRESYYRLSGSGWRETKAVWGRVYGRVPPVPPKVLLVVGPPDMAPAVFDRAVGRAAVALGPRAALISEPVDLTGMAVAELLPGGVPAWVRDAVAGPELRADYAGLTSRLEETAIAARPDDPVGTAALRLIVLHQWRRLCLRHGEMPDALLPADWEGARARAAVMDVLDALPTPALAELDAAVRDPDADGAAAG